MESEPPFLRRATSNPSVPMSKSIRPSALFRNRSPWDVLAMLALALPLGTTAHSETYRDFTNHSGQTLRATIVSATDTEVTLKREDGGQVTGGIAFFSEGDQAHISEWRKANPTQYSYDFDIQATRQRGDRTKTTEGNLIVIYETWKFAIKVENRSKTGTSGVPVDGIEIHYNLAKTAKSRARRAGELHQGMVRAEGMLVKTGKLDLGSVEYLKSKTVETEIVPVNQSELAPGWYYTDGSKDEHKDVLEGISIQIRKDGKVIAEKVFGSKALSDAKWVDPGGGNRRRR